MHRLKIHLSNDWKNIENVHVNSFEELLFITRISCIPVVSGSIKLLLHQKMM